jgi:acyl-CoA synthetase (AMP-forming)/AMP-acid ligase II
VAVAVSQVIADVFRPALSHRPKAPAVVARSGTLTYADLDRAAAAAAGALWELGVRPGDRVAACLPNDLDIVVTFHGAMRIGAIWVGINEAYTRDEQQALADLAAPALVMAGPRWKADGAAAVGTREWARVTAAAPEAPTVEIDPDAPAGIAFTSGTTGVPRGIVHSQRNMLLPGAALVRTRGWGPGLRKGDCLPLTLLNMQILTTLLTAQAEGCCVLMDRRDVTGVADWIGRERVTVWNGVPAQLYDLARQPGLDLSGLAEAWCGGAACPDELRQAFYGVHGVPVRATYGLTEAPTVVAIDPMDGSVRAGAAGLVLPQFDVAAYDEEGRRLPAGSTGELRIGPAIAGEWAGAWTPAPGEWRDGEVVPTMAAPIATGDIGAVDADGWLSVVERKKLVIVRGGANVYPAEVERVIRRHPAVAEVAVFGIPDERLGEKVAALVRLGAPADLGELRAVCGAHLARYKVPEVWSEVDKFPVNAMGKIIRTSLPGLLAGRSG